MISYFATFDIAANPDIQSVDYVIIQNARYLRRNKGSYYSKGAVYRRVEIVECWWGSLNINLKFEWEN